MKNISSLYQLKMNIIIKSAVLVIPTVVVIAFLGTMYAVLPHQISGSFLLSGILLFFISVYVSMVIQSKEDDVHEDLLKLHSRVDTYYYISRELVIYSISFFYGIILIAYPLIRNITTDGFFTRQLKPEDVLFGSLLLLGNGICGVAVGDFFHHRIIPKRRYGIIAVTLVTVLALCKVPIIEKIPFMKVLNYILPPLTDGLKMVGDTDIFSPKGSTMICIHSIIYMLVLMLVKIKLLKRGR